MDKEMTISYSNTTTAINMPKERFMNLFLINVIIDEETIPLVFDTGASITVISESLSKSVKAIPLSDSVTAGNNTGNIETVFKSIIPKLRIGNNTIKNLSLIVVPDDNLDFGIDEEGNRLIVNGFLGWDVIKSFKWTIDPDKKNYTIEKPQWSEDKGLLYWDNMPIINAKYHDNKMYFGFDSGHTESMFSKEFIPFIDTKEENTDEIVGIGGRIKEEVYLVNDIKLSISNKEIRLNNISALKRDLFPTKEFKVMGLLSADIIQNYKCIIDFTNQDFQLI